ncbi:hypothetical protein HPP92_023133 [Vanilla planifolia]|uniref:Uncharacterized protein n=1 Tax=Vanilla planifolia TaxID=51239 RepID=A0A835PWP2_VANPL|nr:hypothetical protein HPP92_023133 [Vanilla planifolia]
MLQPRNRGKLKTNPSPAKHAVCRRSTSPEKPPDLDGWNRSPAMIRVRVLLRPWLRCQTNQKSPKQIAPRYLLDSDD